MRKGVSGAVIGAVALMLISKPASAYDERIPYQLRAVHISVTLHKHKVRKARKHRRHVHRGHYRRHYAHHRKARHYRLTRREAIRRLSNSVSTAGVPLLASAARYLGGNPTGWARVWCGRFMRMIVGRDPGPRYNLARNWAHYGKPSRRRPGAIAVMRGHVGVVAGNGGRCGPGRVYILSGNHGRRVGYGCYATSRIIAYRSNG